MVFAASSSVDDRLGELLLSHGRLSLQQFIDGSKAMGTGKRLGTVLVEMGALTPKDPSGRSSSRHKRSFTACFSGPKVTIDYRKDRHLRKRSS